MSTSAQPDVTRETIRRWTREVVGLEISESDLDSLTPILTMLRTEVVAVVELDRSGREPVVQYRLAEWPR